MLIILTFELSSLGKDEMSQDTLEQVLDKLNTLNSDELKQVGSAVRERLAPAEEADKRRRFYDALRAAGLIGENKSSRPIDRETRRPVPVQGEPVSKTIIQERR
jgi:hypothetical protein